jgi:hypothetical protein
MQTDMRPPYVRFERRPVEDRTKLLQSGRYGFKDVDIACITSPGQKDIVERPAQEWLTYLAKQADDGRIPSTWVEHFRKTYDSWQQGQEAPVSGTPIKGWALLSPAQQENVIQANIRSVEDLAAANDSAIGAIGMGGLTYRDKARAWLAESEKQGSTAEQLASLQRDNEALKAQVAELLKSAKQLPELLK